MIKDLKFLLLYKLQGLQRKNETVLLVLVYALCNIRES